jgi:integrase
MAKVRARADNKLLFLDFYYRGVRCREQTALPDTAENRKKVQALLNRVQKEIRHGVFDYATTFPASTKAARFAESTLTGGVSQRQEPVNRIETGRDPVAVVTPTFRDFSETWRGEMAPQWRRLHRGSVDAIFKAHLLPAFGGKPVATIGKAEILAFRAALAELPGRGNKKLSAPSINKIIGILRQCLAEAADRFGLPDCFKGIKRLKARRPDIHPFSLQEVEQILVAVRSDFRDYCAVRFFTGMRTGEINGLKWKYVDFDKELILVRETFAAGEAEGDAKTESSLRDIPMLPMVKEALLAQQECRHPESDYVFSTRDGNPIDAHNFANRIWYPLLRYLGLDKRRPYQTRHTTATLMLASGENPEWIARLMGHTNTQMLFTVYSRFVPNLTRQDGLAIAGLLSRRAHASNNIMPSAPDLESMTPDELRAELARLRSSAARPTRRSAVTLQPE